MSISKIVPASMLLWLRAPDCTGNSVAGSVPRSAVSAIFPSNLTTLRSLTGVSMVPIVKDRSSHSRDGQVLGPHFSPQPESARHCARDCTPAEVSGSKPRSCKVFSSAQPAVGNDRNIPRPTATCVGSLIRAEARGILNAPMAAGFRTGYRIHPSLLEFPKAIQSMLMIESPSPPMILLESALITASS